MFARSPVDFFFSDMDPYFSSPLDDFFFTPLAIRPTGQQGQQGQQQQQRIGGGEYDKESQGGQQLAVQGGENTGLTQAQRRELMLPRVNMDLVAEKDRYMVKAEIPGLNKNEINVSFNNGLLSINGVKQDEHRQEETREGVTLIRKERSMGSFSRTIRLPRDAAEKNISAKLQNGVLCVCIPRTAQQQQETAGRIEIEEVAGESTPQSQAPAKKGGK